MGHGPFSHTFDGLVIPKLDPSNTWTHEIGSEMLLDDLIETYNIDMESNQLNFIKGLIRGKRNSDYDIGISRSKI